jgi:uncharacterized protein
MDVPWANETSVMDGFLGKRRSDGSGRPSNLFIAIRQTAARVRQRVAKGSPDQLDRHVANDVGLPSSIAISLARNRCRSLAQSTLEQLEQNEAITMSVRDNKERRRYELDIEGSIAFANYRVTPDAVIITHTETPPALRGRGVASELVKGALELVRADGRKVIAGCSFVVDYLQRHPEHADIVV